jgi:hypothetical protein
VGVTDTSYLFYSYALRISSVVVQYSYNLLLKINFDSLFTQENSDIFQACITQLTSEQQQALHEILNGVN